MCRSTASDMKYEDSPLRVNSAKTLPPPFTSTIIVTAAGGKEEEQKHENNRKPATLTE